jgi:hypothetical protein
MIKTTKGARRMLSIAIEPELYRRVEKAALEQQSSIDQILNKAIHHYLWELDRRKISEESKLYRQQHAELKTRYLGQYIAMHNGQIVDYDPDFTTLRQRVRQRFQDTPIMLTLVEDVAEQVWVRHGFRLESSNL